jgi:predicted site-specific integrase-resolvase
MDYLTIKETAEKWGVSGRMVTHYCVAGRIPGVIRKGNMWLIPADADKPRDTRGDWLKKPHNKKPATKGAKE